MSIQLCGGLDPSARPRDWMESTEAVGLLFAGQGPKCHIGQLSSNQAVWCDCAVITTTPTIVRLWQSKRGDPESTSGAGGTGTPVQRAGRGASAQGSRCWERRPFPRVGCRASLWANHAPPRAARTSGCSAHPLFWAVLGLARAKLSTVFVYCCSLGLAVSYLSITLAPSRLPHLSCPVLAGSRSSSTLWPFAPPSPLSPSRPSSSFASLVSAILPAFLSSVRVLSPSFLFCCLLLLSFCPTLHPLNRPSITRLNCSFFCDFQPALEGWDTSPTDEGVTYAALPIGH
jgi:hypothetical protein